MAPAGRSAARATSEVHQPFKPVSTVLCSQWAPRPVAPVGTARDGAEKRGHARSKGVSVGLKVSSVFSSVDQKRHPGRWSGPPLLRDGQQGRMTSGGEENEDGGGRRGMVGGGWGAVRRRRTRRTRRMRTRTRRTGRTRRRRRRRRSKRELACVRILAMAMTQRTPR